MTALPSALALTVINADAEILSADHRNNYAAIQTAVNELIAALAGGTSGQLLSAIDASDVQYVNSPAGVSLAAIEALFTAAGQLFVGLGSGSGELLNFGSNGQILAGVSGLPAWKTPGNSSSNPGNKSTTSATKVMAGLAGSFTPAFSGRVRITIDGYNQAATSGFGGDMLMAYGTGTAPTTGAAATGTTVGADVSNNAGANNVAFSMTRIVTGLTIGTAYWVDLQFSSNNSPDSFNVKGLTISVDEF